MSQLIRSSNVHKKGYTHLILRMSGVRVWGTASLEGRWNSKIRGVDLRGRPGIDRVGFGSLRVQLWERKDEGNAEDKNTEGACRSMSRR